MAADMPVSVIAIAGITGKLGQLTAETILSTSDCRVQGFCRDKSKVAPALRDNSRVTIVEGQSSDPEAARKAVRGSQVVICMYLVCSRGCSWPLSTACLVVHYGPAPMTSTGATC